MSLLLVFGILLNLVAVGVNVASYVSVGQPINLAFIFLNAICAGWLLFLLLTAV